MDERQLLEKPISELSFGPAFLEKCGQMGFKNLEDIIDTEPRALVAKPGFDYHWLAELSALLAKEKMLHLLQAIPGKIVC